MGDAIRPQLFINGKRMKRPTNVNMSPEGGETNAEFGMLEDPVGISTSPYGLAELTFDVVPMVVNGQIDAETGLFDDLEYTREKFSAVIKTGTHKMMMTECVMQPRSEVVEEGASKNTISRRAKGKIVRRPQ